MTRLWLNPFLAASLLLLAVNLPALAAANEAPDFKEVFELIRTNSGLNEAELNRAAVQGLLSALGAKASLAANGTPTNAPSGAMLVSRTNLFEGDIVYLRIARVGDGLARVVDGACLAAGATNKLKGIVLDLRYADGVDYAAAVAVANLFAAGSEPLLNWGNGMVSSQKKDNPIQAPVAVLVNRETACAAEALAAVLRNTSAGLILGSRTAGQAMVMREFLLKAGGRLRIATSPVTLGDGSVLSAEGIKPDIEVAVSAQDERAYYANAFATLTADAKLTAATRPGETNRAGTRNRLNEAELVRVHKEGMDRDVDVDPPLVRTPPPPPEPEQPLVNDPVLVRALDLLRALALVR